MIILGVASVAASKSLTPEQRVQRARIAANTRWGRDSERKANAERAQAGLLERFRRDVLEHDPYIAEPELTERAKALRKAHMARLAFASSKARRTLESDTDGGHAA